MDDFELLQAYASGKREDAFTTLTGRYVNLVYSAALRQTSDTHAAEDITQAVFLTLARKAGSISRRTILVGWLLRTTRFAAANARRLNQCREHYEQQAMHSYVCPNESEAAWHRIAPFLDDALDQLNGKDRDAVVLRFFEQKSLRSVAQQLGLSEGAAQKRVSRAIDKLRLYFARHGKTVSGAALTGALGANAVQVAPASLGASACALVSSTSADASSMVAALAQATSATLARIRFQTLALRAGGVAAVMGLVALTAIRVNQSPTGNAASAGSAATVEQASVSLPVDTATVAVADPAPAAGQLFLRVVDSQSQAPVPQVRLTLVSDGAAPRRTTNVFVTDARGESVIPYVAVAVKSWSHRIEVFRDGYVPKYVSWSESQQDRIDEIPAEYTVRIDRAVTIGGVVLDEQDAGVSSLAVVFSVSGPTASRARERLTMMGNYHTEMTDDHGRWQCNHVPARFGMIDYKMVHPLFEEKMYASDSPDSPNYINIDRIPQGDLLAQRAIMRVKRGLTIAGMVTDEHGQPIAGAKVTQNYDFRRPERNIFTDADGTFRFGNGRARELALTVQADGLAPIVTSLVMNASVEDIRFTLPSGRMLSGRVVDEAGQPVNGATVEAASPTRDSRTLFEWRTRTDADGYFYWLTAPASQEYAVYASGFESASRVTLSADTHDQVVQLKRKAAGSVRIVGHIMDAEAKIPPTAAQIQIWQTTLEPGGRQSTFTTRAEDVAPSGEFRLKTSSGTLSYVLEATADGYWPERVTNQVTSVSEVSIKMTLKRAPAFGGMVLTPDDKPAAGAAVVICGPQEWPQMTQRGKLHLGTANSTVGVTTDSAGRFRLPPKYAPEVVVVAHGEGFAEVPFAGVTSNTLITLQQWGRIEGVAMLAGKALAGETIRLNGMWRRNSSPRVSLYMGATPDADGNFAFESVPPGEWTAQHELKITNAGSGIVSSPAFSHGVPVVVRSGETSRVVIGGSGCAVVGKAIPPDANQSISWTLNTATLALKVPSLGAPEEPLREHFASDQEFAAARAVFGQRNQSYWTSDEGLAVQRRRREYRGVFATDGSFRIDDVPAGDYTLKIDLMDPPQRPGPDFMKIPVIATLQMDVTIPQITGNSEAPVDLGALQLAPVPPRNVSSTAVMRR